MTFFRVLLNVLISLDQTANCLWHINGDGWGRSDEMISARAFRCYLQGLITERPMLFINALFFWQTDGCMNLNHCWRAWRTEIERRQLPDHYLGAADAAN